MKRQKCSSVFHTFPIPFITITIFILHISFINCAAVTRLVQKPHANESVAASEINHLKHIDPKKESASSYSTIETIGSKGSAKSEVEPRAETTQLRSQVDEQKVDTSFFSDDSPLSKRFSYQDSDSFFADNRKFKKEARSTTTKRPKSSKATSYPKSINEIVEKSQSQPILSSSSKRNSNSKNDDLSRAGSYFQGSLGADESYEEGHEKEKHYDKEAGKKFVEAHKAEAGEKADQGYKKEEGYDKVEKQQHGKEGKKAVVAEKEVSKKGHKEEEKHFGEEHTGQEGEKGISVTKKGGQKKGHKKNGFHKVHHHDEFKKDETFYDEGHDGDEHEEHAHEHEKHANEKGGAAKKNSLESAYHEGHGEKKGEQDKGHHFEEALGHKKEAGQKKHHDEQSKYGKKGGVKEGAKFGHAEGGASGGGYLQDGY